jgi:hypothetical protein
MRCPIALLDTQGTRHAELEQMVEKATRVSQEAHPAQQRRLGELSALGQYLAQ